MPPPLSEPDLERFMREALAEAEAAGHAGDYPIGAVVVRGGEVVSRGRAGARTTHSQLAHAELAALLPLTGDEWSGRNDDAVLFTTMEPCPMCLGATVMMDIEHVVFALHDPLAGMRDMLEIPYVARHIQTYRGGVLADDALELLGRLRPEMLAYLSRGTE